MMVLSTNEAIWDPPMPRLESLERIRGMGFRGITTGIGAGMDKAELPRLKKAYGRFDSVAFHAPFGDTAPLSADADERGAKWDQYAGCIESAAALGAKAVTFHPGDPDPALAAGEGDALMAALMRRLDAVALEHGVWACWETGTGYFHSNDRFEFIRSLGLKKTGICLDTGHVMRVWRTVDAPTRIKTFTDFFDRFGDLIKDAHIHDWLDDPKGPHTWNDHHPIGAGVIDWDEVFGGFVRIGYAGGLCMEYHPLVVGSDEEFARHLENIRRQIRELGGDIV